MIERHHHFVNSQFRWFFEVYSTEHIICYARVWIRANKLFLSNHHFKNNSINLAGFISDILIESWYHVWMKTNIKIASLKTNKNSIEFSSSFLGFFYLVTGQKSNRLVNSIRSSHFVSIVTKKKKEEIRWWSKASTKCQC